MAGPASGRTDRGPVGRLGWVAIAVAGIAILAVAGSAFLGSSPARPDGSPTGSGPALSAVDPSTGPAPPPGHEVYGFIPYWEMDDTIVAHLKTVDLTTVALFSVTHSGKGALALTQNGAKKIQGPVGKALIAAAHERHMRVDLAYTSFGQKKNAALFGSKAIQDRVISGLVKLRKDLKVDGIAVDVEQIDDADVPAYGAFVAHLRTALRADHPDATLTVTTSAGRQGAALALAASVAGADRIFLMGYDYRTGGSEPGASSPISRRDGDQRTLAWSLDLYAAAGVPPERTLLGLPLYGVAWPSTSRDLGAASTAKGAVWIPRQHLAALRNPTLVPVYDQLESVAFLAIPDGAAFQAVYFDTPESLTPKLALADERGLAGAGLWAVGYERGLPGYTDLVATFREGRIRTAEPAGSSGGAVP
jgi:spore germination protein YaaH